MRNAEDTKRRILAAATEEFTRHGIAGARVGRIAAAAHSNKAMLYAYFGNKEQLFEAVFAVMVTAATDAVPFDAHDLPGYAVAMFDRYRTDPHVARLSDWYRLEHGKPGPDDAVSAAQLGRLAAIAKAQRDQGDQRPAHTAGTVQRDHRAHPDGHPGIHSPQPAQQHRSRPHRRTRHRQTAGPALTGTFPRAPSTSRSY